MNCQELSIKNFNETITTIQYPPNMKSLKYFDKYNPISIPSSLTQLTIKYCPPINIDLSEMTTLKKAKFKSKMEVSLPSTIEELYFNTRVSIKDHQIPGWKERTADLSSFTQLTKIEPYGPIIVKYPTSVQHINHCFHFSPPEPRYHFMEIDGKQILYCPEDLSSFDYIPYVELAQCYLASLPKSVGTLKIDSVERIKNIESCQIETLELIVQKPTDISMCKISKKIILKYKNCFSPPIKLPSYVPIVYIDKDIIIENINEIIIDELHYL